MRIPPPVPISQGVMEAVLLRFLEMLGNRAPARRREARRERAFRDADETSLDDPAQPPSMAAQQRAPISLLNQDGQRVGLLHARGGGQRAARRGARGRGGGGRRAGGGGHGGDGGRRQTRDRQGAGRSCGKARCPLPPLPANMIQTVMDKKRRFLLFFGLKGPSACALRPMFEQNSWSKARAVSLFPNGNRETVRFCPELADASAEPRLTRIHAR